jgi:hypothetical protein
METLGRDTFHSVLARLDFLDLIAASSSCRLLRDAADPAGPLWQDLCHRRWGTAGGSGGAALNTSVFPVEQPDSAAIDQGQPQQQAGADYKAILLQDNGWADPGALSVQQYAGSAWSDEVVAVQPSCSAAGGGACSIAVSSCRELRILSLEGSPGAQLQVQYAGTHAAHSRGELWSSLAPVPPEAAGGSAGLVAAGGCRGRLALFRLPPNRSTAPSRLSVQPAAMLTFPGNR